MTASAAQTHQPAHLSGRVLLAGGVWPERRLDSDKLLDA